MEHKKVLSALNDFKKIKTTKITKKKKEETAIVKAKKKKSFYQGRDKSTLVEYSNEFATSINEYSAYELDLVLCLAYVARKEIADHKNVPIEKNLVLKLPASSIKKIMQGNVSSARLNQSLRNIFNTNVFFREDNFTKVRHIFEGLDFNDDYSVILFELKKEFIHLFFNLTGNFAQHEILEFTSLKGKYAKKIYQIIMAYRDLKHKEYPADVFRKLLDIPEKYRWTDIETKVMDKIREEYKKTNIKDVRLLKTKEGRTITKVKLVWEIASPEIVENEKLDKEPVEEEEEIEEADVIVEFFSYTPEQEKKAIRLCCEEEGIEESFMLNMRDKSKVVYDNTIKKYIKRVIEGDGND